MMKSVVCLKSMFVNYIYDHRTRSNASGVEILLNIDFVIQSRHLFGLFLILALEKHFIRHTDLSALEDIGQYQYQSIYYRLTQEHNFLASVCIIIDIIICAS